MKKNTRRKRMVQIMKSNDYLSCVHSDDLGKCMIYNRKCWMIKICPKGKQRK
jgi:hypothetical protein